MIGRSLSICCQIGRSLSSAIDFCVIDTLPGCEEEQDAYEAIRKRCLVSRFACRILVDRAPPHQARLYAAAFNDHHDIFLGVRTVTESLCFSFSCVLAEYFCLGFWMQRSVDAELQCELNNTSRHCLKCCPECGLGSVFFFGEQCCSALFSADVSPCFG